MSAWRATWSMVGRWLVYVPNPEGGEEQISLPRHMGAEAHKLAAADDVLEALELAEIGLVLVAQLHPSRTADTALRIARAAIARAHGEAR